MGCTAACVRCVNEESRAASTAPSHKRRVGRGWAEVESGGGSGAVGRCSRAGRWWYDGGDENRDEEGAEMTGDQYEEGMGEAPRTADFPVQSSGGHRHNTRRDRATMRSDEGEERGERAVDGREVCGPDAPRRGDSAEPRSPYRGLEQRRSPLPVHRLSAVGRQWDWLSAGGLRRCSASAAGSACGRLWWPLTLAARRAEVGPCGEGGVVRATTVAEESRKRSR